MDQIERSGPLCQPPVLPVLGIGATVPAVALGRTTEMAALAACHFYFQARSLTRFAFLAGLVASLRPGRRLIDTSVQSVAYGDMGLPFMATMPPRSALGGVRALNDKYGRTQTQKILCTHL